MKRSKLRRIWTQELAEMKKQYNTQNLNFTFKEVGITYDNQLHIELRGRIQELEKRLSQL